MTKSLLHFSDMQLLYYFSVVAEENNLTRAAERLFMSQPPLSRQIQQLEERLGVPLFTRHSKGLTLTEDGAQVLRIIKPALKKQEAMFAELYKEINARGTTLRVGLTTAFEQGVFAKLVGDLSARYGTQMRVLRAGSPKLIKEIRQGRLNAALVALPLEAPGILVWEIGYAEPLMAALPAGWPEALAVKEEKQIELKCLSERKLFWFKREKNPAFFDYSKGLFNQAGFAPSYIEEPLEHDVLLARIASGEGFGLFASSFISIQREGVVFSCLSDKNIISLQLGIAVPPNNSTLGEELAAVFMASRQTE